MDGIVQEMKQRANAKRTKMLPAAKTTLTGAVTILSVVQTQVKDKQTANSIHSLNFIAIAYFFNELLLLSNTNGFP